MTNYNLNRTDRRILKTLANKIVGAAKKDLKPKLSGKESELYRRLATYYDVNNDYFKQEWIDAFPDMNDKEATVTMKWSFEGLDNRITKLFKDRIKEEKSK